MPIAFLFAVTAFFPFLTGSDQPSQSSLAVIQAGVQQSEEAPFVTTDYRFQPGDYLYFTFNISGFGVQTDSETKTRRISLSYEVTPQDDSGRALAKPESGDIAVELAPEDKNWTPKRSASFILPSGIAAGDFQVHVAVKDAILKTKTSKDVPFRIGGVSVQPTPSISVEHFEFLRKELDHKPLEVPAYSAGDSVYLRFDSVGFEVEAHNQYHLAYGIKVLGPDGKTFLEQPNAAEAEEGSFYPAQFVPGNLQINTKPNAAKGKYTVLLSVHDLIAKQTYTQNEKFTVE